MKRFLLLAVLLPFAALAEEVLVLTTSTSMPIGTYRKGVELQNLGPNPIFCDEKGGTPVINKSRRVAAGEAWALDAPSTQRINCICSVNQVTGAATIYSEVR